MRRLLPVPASAGLPRQLPWLAVALTCGLASLPSAAFAADPRLLGAPASSARAGHSGDMVRLFLAGPTIFAVLLAVLAVVALLGMAVGRLDRLVAIALAGARRLDSGKVVPGLWGVCAALILFALIVILFATKVLGLLGALLFLIALSLAALGLAASAVACGRAVHGESATLDLDDLAHLRTGLWLLFFASILPVLGWLVVLLAIACGLGGVVQTLFARRD